MPPDGRRASCGPLTLTLTLTLWQTGDVLHVDLASKNFLALGPKKRFNQACYLVITPSPRRASTRHATPTLTLNLSPEPYPYPSPYPYPYP